jgi:hypothetical protein
MRTVFWLENLKGRDHLEDIGLDGKIIFVWILGKYGGGVDCKRLTQDRDQWWALLDTNLWVP